MCRSVQCVGVPVQAQHLVDWQPRVGGFAECFQDAEAEGDTEGGEPQFPIRPRTVTGEGCSGDVACGGDVICAGDHEKWGEEGEDFVENRGGDGGREGHGGCLNWREIGC